MGAMKVNDKKKNIENGIIIRDGRFTVKQQGLGFRALWCTDSSTPLGGGFVGCSYVAGVIFVNLLSVLRFVLV